MMRNIVFLKAEIVSMAPLFIGDDDGNVLIDDETNMAYLPATSIAGSFKAYLKSIDEDYKMLFGTQDEKNSIMSSVYVKDAFAKINEFDRRDGVRIDNESGSNVGGCKIERLYLGQGLKFDLGFEIHGEEDNIEDLKNMIYKCLNALDEGIIRLGGHKSNGLGIFKIISAKEIKFNLNDKEDLFKYLKKDHSGMVDVKETIDNVPVDDRYVKFVMKGEFTTPLLIKAPKTFNPKDVDDRSIKSGDEYLIPGSSFKGVLRSRVEKIAKYFGSVDEASEIFGSINGKDKENILSRVFVRESIIDNRKFEEKVYYNRIKIDKFTGGVRHSGLVNDMPVQGKTQFDVMYRKKNDEKFDDYAIGILALALRDLGTENLTVGGGNNIGRGRFKASTMTISKGDKFIEIDFDKRSISDEEILNCYIEAVKTFTKGGKR